MRIVGGFGPEYCDVLFYVKVLRRAGLMGYKHVDTGVRMLEGGNGFKFTNALNEEVEIREGARWSPSNVRSHSLEKIPSVALHTFRLTASQTQCYVKHS